MKKLFIILLVLQAWCSTAQTPLFYNRFAPQLQQGLVPYPRNEVPDTTHNSGKVLTYTATGTGSGSGLYWKTAGGGSSSLTSTYIGYGSPTNLLIGDAFAYRNPAKDYETAIVAIGSIGQSLLYVDSAITKIGTNDNSNYGSFIIINHDSLKFSFSKPVGLPTGYDFPVNHGTSGQVLTDNGIGNLYWATPGGGGTDSATRVGFGMTKSIGTTFVKLAVDTASRRSAIGLPTIYFMDSNIIANRNQASLASTQIGYGSGGGTLTGDGNFVYVTGQGIGLHDNSTSNSIFIGTPQSLAGNSTTQGGNNIGIGGLSLTQIAGNNGFSGQYNVAIGVDALNATTTGSNNVAIGQSALGNIQVTGNDLVGIGSGDVSADGWNNSIGLGNGWSITASNQFVVGGNGATAITQWVISNIAYNMPSAQGGTGTVLTNDGAGNLSWAASGGGGSSNNLQIASYITAQTGPYSYAPYTNTDVNPHTYRVGITTTFYSGASGYVNETVTYTDENSNTQTVYFASYDNNITAGVATLTTFIGNSGAGVYTCPVKDIIVGAGQSIQITIAAVTLASSTYDANASIFLIN